MKNKWISPMLLAGLTLVLILVAGCNRPDAQAPLENQPVATLSAVGPATATLAAGEMPPNLAATVAAGSPGVTLAAPAAAPAATDTPLPPQAPAPTPTPIPPIATSTPVPPGPAPTSAPGGARIHTVQPGERLFSIGRLYNVNPYAIAQANNIPAPYLIFPGQKLNIPSSSGVTPVPGGGGQTYVVQPGDNLFRISLRFGRSMQAIAAANGIGNISLIFVGQVLRIP